jgi:hypothetical protein
MGYYDRCNIGDEIYKEVIPKLLVNCNIVCVSIDDLLSLCNPIQYYDIVFIGGGDLVNDYFMNKMQQLLKTYTGRVYGLSLGIPFLSCCHYLHIFDHVIVRSYHDYTIASKEIGAKNVSYFPDFSVTLCEKEFETSRSRGLDNTTDIVNVGLCLAQPLFYKNPKKKTLLDALCNALQTFATTSSKKIRFILLAFNSNINNNQECDHIINSYVAKQLQKQQVDIIIRHDIIAPLDMLNYFQTQK